MISCLLGAMSTPSHCGSPRQSDPPRVGRGVIAGLLGVATLLTGCNSAVPGPSVESGTIAVDSQSPSLRANGLAILMPTAASDHEEDRQTVALIFTSTLAERRPDLPAIPLAKTLSAINAAGLADSYAHLYRAYRDTGLFDGQSLQKIGQAVGARYLVQLKLASFDKSSAAGVFSFVGLSLGRQQTATVRLFVQMWDSVDGKIVWERSNETSEKKRSLIRDRTIKMEDIVRSDVEELIKQLPRG